MNTTVAMLGDNYMYSLAPAYATPGLGAGITTSPIRYDIPDSLNFDPNLETQAAVSSDTTDGKGVIDFAKYILSIGKDVALGILQSKQQNAQSTADLVYLQKLEAMRQEDIPASQVEPYFGISKTVAPWLIGAGVIGVGLVIVLATRKRKRRR